MEDPRVAMTMKAEEEFPYAGLLLAVLAGLTVLRGLFAAFVDLSPDEAYYWSWSTRLAFGYYDHPPAVAWLIAAGTALLPGSELGVRLPALLCSSLCAWTVFAITRDLTGSGRQAFWVAMLLSFSPIFSVGAVIHTPDALLAAAWAGAVWFALRAARFERLVDWIGLGACIGVAILAKLTGWFLLPCLGLFAFCCNVGRSSLKRPGPALTLLVAAVVVLPNLLWSGGAGGGAYAFQLAHTTRDLGFSAVSFLAFLGGQAGVVSPLLWIGLVLFMAVSWRREVRFGRNPAFLMWCFSAPLFLFCLLLSIVLKVEANWPVMAYIAALPGAAWAWTGGRFYLRRIRLWVGLTLSVSFVLTLLIHLQALSPFLPVEDKLDATARLRGWRELSREAVREADRLGAELAAEGYGPVSELLFYTGRPVFYERSSTRLSQYDLWKSAPPQGTILFLQPVSTKSPPKICEQARASWILEKVMPWWVCER
jgi:4-amino-4-deoxy-L-arabinose transferase-like glycosyltransferase